MSTRIDGQPLAGRGPSAVAAAVELHRDRVSWRWQSSGKDDETALDNTCVLAHDDACESPEANTSSIRSESYSTFVLLEACGPSRGFRQGQQNVRTCVRMSVTMASMGVVVVSEITGRMRKKRSKQGTQNERPRPALWSHQPVTALIRSSVSMDRFAGSRPVAAQSHGDASLIVMRPRVQQDEKRGEGQRIGRESRLFARLDLGRLICASLWLGGFLTSPSAGRG